MNREPVVIIGAGPSGLAAAAALAPHTPVLVLEREAQAGGIPRHCAHQGFGLRDLHRSLSGPAYAQRLVRAALDAGVRIETRTMVTGWASADALEVTGPGGRRTVSADAIVLATGARERARAARRIPGDRPAGVYTTGQLQQAVHLHHQGVGTRAVIVGAEAVSWSAVLTLREAGCAVVGLVTRHERPDAYAPMARLGSLALHVGVRTSTEVTAVLGHGRVTGVEVADRRTGAREVIACDTVVFTGDWIPDHELARLAGLMMDAGTRGPAVDTALRTSQPHVFAVGNLVHPVDTADVAALDGRHVVHAVRTRLAGLAPLAAPVPIVAEAPFTWVAPSLMRPGDIAPARGRLLLWSDALVPVPRVVVRQDGRVLARQRLPWPAAPGRVFRVPWSMLGAVRGDGGPVSVSLG